jgi:ketosteroid isomerase-like protein
MSRKVLVVLAVIVAVAVGVGLLAYVIETDEEAIERITLECRDAFLAGDVDRILAHLEPEATGTGWLGRGSLADGARRAVERYSSKVTAIEFARKEIRVDGEEAEGSWLAWVKIRDVAPGQAIGVMKVKARVEYRRGADGWRIRRVEVSAP